MGLAHLGRVNLVEPVNRADLAGDIVVQALERVGHVAVFAHAPIELPKIAVDQVEVGLLDQLAVAGVLLAVENVGLGRLLEGGGQQRLFDNVLDAFDRRGVFSRDHLNHAQYAQGERLGDILAELAGRPAGLENCLRDLPGVEDGQLAVSLADRRDGNGHGVGRIDEIVPVDLSGHQTGYPFLCADAIAAHTAIPGTQPARKNGLTARMNRHRALDWRTTADQADHAFPSEAAVD